MPKVTGQDPIDYLVARKYRLHAARWYQTPNPNPGQEPETEYEKLQLQRRAEKYRLYLERKPLPEIIALVEKEKEKERLERLAKAERDERARFFNQPEALADFAHWSKATYWTLDEALALSLGRDPKQVNWESVKPYIDVSAFAQTYARIRDLAIRAKNWKEIFDPVMPAIFLAWARRKEIDVPEHLVNAVQARGVVIADWKDICEKLQADLQTAREDIAKLLAVHEQVLSARDTLQKKITELEEKCAAWEFDPGAEDYPEELDIALQAWWAVRQSRDPAHTVKIQILNWLEHHYPKLADGARQRIATVCNWVKTGGRLPRN